MNRAELLARLHTVVATPMPLPGEGRTAQRHLQLMAIGREDLSLARLAEAHYDAISILAEAGRKPVDGALYGVWASEIPGRGLVLEQQGRDWTVSGTKLFCSGGGLVDRALLTVAVPEVLLVDVEVQNLSVHFDFSAWKTTAFEHTGTATARFDASPVAADAVLGDAGWYTGRPGFWHGACGPASCWAGGAAGLLDYVLGQKRNDAHTLAHLGAMHADFWSLRACLTTAGDEIDAHCGDAGHAYARALTVRHLVEQACSDILRRVGRAYGPAPLAMDADVGRRYQELDLYIRQCHAERDLAALGAYLQQR